MNRTRTRTLWGWSLAAGTAVLLLFALLFILSFDVSTAAAGAERQSGAAFLPPGAPVTINEIRIDQSSTDNDEYFELAGQAGTSLDGLTYLVIGDGSGGSGTIEAVVPLTGTSIPADGHYLAVEGSFTLGGSPDLVTSLNFENGDNVTHLLVAGFSGLNGDDLDTDDDGVLDVAPWTAMEDCVALIADPAGGDQTYCGTSVGPDGSFVPAQSLFCINQWAIGNFSNFDFDTPGVANTTCPVRLNEIRTEQPGADNDEYFEIAGIPGASMDGLTYIVIGDGAGGSGVIEAVIPLTGTVVPADGHFLAVEATFTITGTPDITVSLNFEGSDNVTHMLIRDFSGSNGDDLDTDDDGVLDVMPWSGVQDCLAFIETVGGGEQVYCAAQIGPDGAFVPGQAHLCAGGWQLGNFGDFKLDTAGAPNSTCPVRINELRTEQSGADDDEYFELAGTAGVPLDGLTYLAIGDGTGGSGVIEAVIPLTGSVLPGDGHFLAAESTFGLPAVPDLVASINFEGSDNVTHLLVRDFSGSNGDDLDTDDNGTLDVTPWAAILDCVAMIETVGSGDQVYCATQVGPDGTSVPGHAYLCSSNWLIGNFSDFTFDTPGLFNSNCPTLGQNIYKSAPAVVGQGALFTYTLTISNQVGMTLTNVGITDSVPANATFAYALDGGGESGGIVSWSLTEVAPFSSAQVRFAVTATTQITNIVNSSYAFTATNSVTPTFGAPVTTTVALQLQIHDIQGLGHFSAYDGQQVLDVPGIITAIGGGGFYLQDPNPDGDVGTSEGIFVFGSAAGLSVGDSVLVSGFVSEFYPGGIGTGNLSTTELTGVTVQLLSSGNPLPPATIVGSGGRIPPNMVIDDDATGDVNTTGTFDPTTDGIDFYESMEGMLVQVNNALVVGGNRFGEIAVVGDNGANATGLNSRGGIVIASDDFNPERIITDDALFGAEPDAKAGDFFTSPITGVLDYNFGNFKLLNVNALPAVNDGGLISETTALSGTADRLTVATLNVENLDPNPSDGDDDSAKFVALASQIVNNLGSPDIIAVQEVQDNSGSTNDGTVSGSLTYQTLITAVINAGGPTYEFREVIPADLMDGGQPGGNIRVGYLFRADRVTFVDRPGGDATTSTGPVEGPTGVELTFSPGRVDPTNIAFDDSRKPVAAEFLFNGHKIFVVNNHFNSKGGDNPLFGRIQPPVFGSEVQRQLQAQVINDFVDSILAVDTVANVVVLGDLNDFQFSAPINTLKGGVLLDLVDTLPATEQYTYIFDGNSQVLDHILVSDNLSDTAVTGFDIVHLNAEFDTDFRPTDHDPAVVELYLPPLVASFVSNSPVVIGNQSNFTDTSSGPGPITYEWDFGDGSAVVTATNPSHTYALTGTYTVVMTATNLAGSTAVTGTHIVVDSLMPGFTSNSPVFVGQLAVFNNTTAGPGTIGYEWDFGDGSPVSTDVNPTHTYAVDGSYTVVLTATNEFESAVVTGSIEVLPNVIFMPVIANPASSTTAADQPAAGQMPVGALLFPAVMALGLLPLRRRRDES